MNNLEIWNKVSQPPKTALKAIEAGRLKGKSDINPQWRYKAMTETFGTCGIGWAYEIEKEWTEKGADDEIMCFVKINLFINLGVEWSRAIPAIGGSTLIAKEKSGMHNSDEAYKMATTDALGVAMKMLGVAADVYMGLWDGTKYRSQEQEDKKVVDKPSVLDRYSKLFNEAKSLGIDTKEWAIDAKLTEAEVIEMGKLLKIEVEKAKGK